jgi:hypothetical protein
LCLTPKRSKSPSRQGECFFIDDRCLFVFVGVVKLILTLSLLLTLSAFAQNVDPALCGPFPKNYKEIVWNWMQGALVDADSAKIEWQGEPKPVDLGKNGTHLYGWLVELRVDSRNRFGQYTGKQSHGALIRDDRVIKGIGFGYRE